MQQTHKDTDAHAKICFPETIQGKTTEKETETLETKLFRPVRCPSCHFPLLEVYGRKHYYIRVKCQKCKFSEIIDTAFFRTVKR